MNRALKRHDSPEAITTDGLRSYGAAMDELGNREKQETGRWANNRSRTATCRSDDEIVTRFQRMSPPRSSHGFSFTASCKPIGWAACEASLPVLRYRREPRKRDS